MKAFVRPTTYEYDSVYESYTIEWSNGDTETHRHLVGSKIKNDSYVAEINDLKDIFKILTESNHPVIISYSRSEDYDLDIEIYNDYRE